MFELDFSHRDSAYNLWFSAKFTFFDRNSGLGHKQTNKAMAGVRRGSEGCSQRSDSRNLPRCSRRGNSGAPKAKQTAVWRRRLGVSGRARLAAMDRMRVLLKQVPVPVDRADVKLRRRAVGDKCSFYCLREMKWVSGKICFIHECISPNRIAEKVLFFANARRAREKDRRIGMFSCAPEWLVK